MSAPPTPMRPLGVWIIAALMTLNVLAFSIKLAATLRDAGGDVGVMASQWGAVRLGSACALMVVLGLASYLLLMMRRWAFGMFALATLASLGTVLWDIHAFGIIASQGYGATLKYLVAPLIYLVPTTYTWRLSREGLLR